MPEFIDLSHTIVDGLVTYKGLPAPIICDFLSREASKAHYKEGTSFHIGMIEMCTNTGTYLDAPFHRFQDGLDISELSLENLANLNAIKIIIPESETEIHQDYFKSLDLSGKALLIQTNWSKHWNTAQYYEGHPYLTKDAAIYLQQSGVILVGIDSYNIDSINDNERPVHSILLGSNILIIEHLCHLNVLPNDDFKFYAVPVKIKGFGTFPVRAFAEINRRDQGIKHGVSQSEDNKSGVPYVR